jgi:hypothetical protein
MMPYIRTSALFLRESDEELDSKTRSFRDDRAGLNEWIGGT